MAAVRNSVLIAVVLVHPTISPLGGPDLSGSPGVVFCVQRRDNHVPFYGTFGSEKANGSARPKSLDLVT